MTDVQLKVSDLNFAAVNGMEVELANTDMYTCEMLDGGYRKKTLSAGDRVVLKDCYQGKREGPILVFRILHSHNPLYREIKSVEIPASKAWGAITGRDFLVMLFNEDGSMSKPNESKSPIIPSTRNDNPNAGLFA